MKYDASYKLLKIRSVICGSNKMWFVGKSHLVEILDSQALGYKNPDTSSLSLPHLTQLLLIIAAKAVSLYWPWGVCLKMGHIFKVQLLEF